MTGPKLNIKSKLPKVGISIFSVMSRLAEEHRAINLSQGFPDFPCSRELVDLVHHYMKKGFNQYAPMQGLMPLREAVAEKIEFMYSAKFSPEHEITVTAGGTQAIYAAISSVVCPGDEVIVFQPAYDCYLPAIELNGGMPVYIDLQYPDYKINWEHVKKRITQRTRLILINTPHNPTGTVLNAFDMMQLEKITERTDILLLSDEVYEHVLFDGLEHQSVLRFPRLAERSFSVFSFGKIFHTTGWKLGYVVAPEYLMKEFRKVHQFMVFSANTPIQHAVADFLKRKEEYLGLGKFFQGKRDYFLKMLKGSRFRAVPAQGTYFQMLNYSKITEEKDIDFSVRLTAEAGVASIPVSAFYHKPLDERVLRFCFAKSEKTLEKAAERLCRI